MRDIEFRGKDFAGFWHHGFLSGALEECAEILEELSGRKICTMVLKETVGQYTGLTDKNGVKIFEADVVRISIPIFKWKPIDGISEVYFDNGCFCVNWGESNRDHGRTRIDSFVPDTGFEVIGNIHDNPELLEGVV